MQFKVGDILEPLDNKYVYTNKGSGLWEVIKIGGDQIKVKQNGVTWTCNYPDGHFRIVRANELALELELKCDKLPTLEY